MRSALPRRALRPAASLLVLAALTGAGCSGDVTRFAYLNNGSGGYGSRTAFEARPQAVRPVSSQPRYAAASANGQLPAPPQTYAAAPQAPAATQPSAAPVQVAAAPASAAQPPVRAVPSRPTTLVAPATAAPAPVAVEAPAVAQTPPAEAPVQVAVASPQPEPAAAPKTDLVATEKATASSDESFKWPVRGRIVSEFGKKPDGQKNDGINLVVPEGTPVKASRDGEVIYAGNELEGYGNLVLVRHPGNWVTAYAHNSELLVKRGDQVRRGQPVAKAGRTGSVSFPQVHFEIRKGATPVDPMQHLSG